VKLDRAAVLEAMRATHIPEATSGLWRVHRWSPRTPQVNRDGEIVAPGTYTSLRRLTWETADAGGEAVMSDDLPELRKHLEPIFRARGRVLVSGLGLGCVVRGFLANPAVEHVDVVERDPDVLTLVRPHLPRERVTIYQADAVAFAKSAARAGFRWDLAWHDLWSDRDGGEPALPITHQRIMLALAGQVAWQGAWAYPRWLREILRRRFPAARAFARAGERGGPGELRARCASLAATS